MKVYGYVRVSSQQQDLNRQKRLIKDYCSSNGYTLIGIESDKISGATTSRKGLDKILGLTKDNGDLVVISELSRLSRESDAHQIINKVYSILDKGLDLVFLDQPDKVYKASEGISFVDYLTLAIKAFGAADERKKIADRMKTGKYSKIAQYPNMLCDSNIPFGFKKVENPNYIPHATPKSFIEIDESKAKYVRMMFQYVLDGMSCSEVARKMKNMNIKGMRQGECLKRLVLQILHNPLYKGERTFKGKTYHINAIVPESDWDEAQKKISQNKTFIGNPTRYVFPLKGILKCPCGQNMTVMHTNRFYACSTVYTGHKCGNSGINIDCLDAIVWRLVKDNVASAEFMEKTQKEIDKILAENVALENSIIEIKDDIIDLHKRMEKLVKKIAAEDNESLYTAFRNQYIEMEKQMKEKETTINNIQNVRLYNNLKITALQNRTAELDDISLTEKKDLYRKTLESVVYYAETTRCGFVVVNYKNSMQSVGIYYIPQKKEMYILPPYAVFNKDTKKVTIKGNEYGVKDLLKKGRAELTALP